MRVNGSAVLRCAAALRVTRSARLAAAQSALMADRTCPAILSRSWRSWRSWGVLGGNSAQDGGELVPGRGAGAWVFSPFPEG